MADNVQPIQRNLYKPDVASYRDGAGEAYDEQLDKLSWPISFDVISSGKRVVDPLLGAGKTEPDFGAEPNFKQAYGDFGIRTTGNPGSPVHKRLFSPSKSLDRGPPSASSQAEVTADILFASGKYGDAIRQYTLGL